MRNPDRINVDTGQGYTVTLTQAVFNIVTNSKDWTISMDDLVSKLEEFSLDDIKSAIVRLGRYLRAYEVDGKLFLRINNGRNPVP